MAILRSAQAFFLSALVCSACAHAKIAQTDIDDTPENHDILSIVESYQKAFESRDAGAILAMVSPRYYEDNGNTDRSDDYDYNGLKANLAEEFQKSKTAHLELRVDEVVVNQEKAFATVYYTYRAQSEFPVGLKWKTGSDFTRISFVKDQNKWLIISGL